MVREVALGTAAGAVGPVTLNAAAYAGRVVRGRTASSLPARVAGELSEKAGLDLSVGGKGSEGDTRQTRRSGLDALPGYVVGLGVGTGYGLTPSSLGGTSKPYAGITLGLAAVAESETRATALGAKDPRHRRLTAGSLMPFLVSPTAERGSCPWVSRQRIVRTYSLPGVMRS